MSPALHDEYVVFDEIARGGMATVHVGLKRAGGGFQRAVALKRLPAEHEDDPARFDMMVDEARLASRLTHPNVVPVLDVVVRDHSLTLVMPLVRGVSLARLLEVMAGGACPPEIAVAIAVDVLAGLEAAHGLRIGAQSLGVIHRDVSPSNVLVSADGVAQLLDFGIAKSSDRRHVTMQRERKGKLAYMAPEQLEGDVDHRVDVYGLAVVLWEMLVGRALFRGATPGAIVEGVLSLSVPRPSRVRPGLPRGLDNVVLRGLERDRAQRWPSARDMRIALEATLPRAAATEVGAWVASLGAAELAKLDAAILRAESATAGEPTRSSGARERGAAGDSRPSLTRRAAVAPVVGVLAGVTTLSIVLGLVGSQSYDASKRAATSSPPPREARAATEVVAAPSSLTPALPPLRDPATPLAVPEQPTAPSLPGPSVTHAPRVAAATRPSPRAKSAPGSDVACELRAWVDDVGNKRYAKVCP